jgi:hypothetical protein
MKWCSILSKAKEIFLNLHQVVILDCILDT